MGVPTQITDHASGALLRLLAQYRDKPLLAGVLNVLNGQTQQIEDALYDLLTERTLANAVGAQLDVIGKIVGEPRGDSVDDAEYRVRIEARVAANNAQGTLDDIFSVFDVLLPSADLSIVQYFPAGFVLDLGESVDPDKVPLYKRFLTDIHPAGVDSQFTWSVDVDAEMFTHSGAFVLREDRTAGFVDLPVLDSLSAPASGTLLIDEGTADEETVAYTINTGNRFTGLTTANNHLTGATIVVLEMEGRGFARAAFLDGDHAAGATTLVVLDPPGTADFDASGTLVIDQGTDLEEAVTYSGKTATSFTGVSATVFNHDARAVVTAVGAFGGKLAGVVKG